MSAQSLSCRLDRILVATDGTESTVAAEHIALDLAGKCGGLLTALGVLLDNPESEIVAPGAFHRAEDLTRTALQRLCTSAESRGIRSTALLRRALDLHGEVAKVAEEEHSDLIVVGRGARTSLLMRLIGDPTSELLALARCGALTVPPNAGTFHHRVLLTTDRPHLSEKGIATAATIAALYRLPITVALALGEPFSGERATITARIATDVYDLLSHHGFDVETLMLRGDPVQVISEAAAARAADLIVVESHSPRGLADLIYGSFALRIMAAIPQPVIVAGR